MKNRETFLIFAFLFSLKILAQKIDIVVPQVTKETATFSAYTNRPNSFILSGNKNRLAVLAKGRVEIWDLTSNLQILKRNHPDAISIELNHVGNVYSVKTKIKGAGSTKYTSELFSISDNQKITSIDGAKNLRFGVNENFAVETKNAFVIYKLRQKVLIEQGTIPKKKGLTTTREFGFNEANGSLIIVYDDKFMGGKGVTTQEWDLSILSLIGEEDSGDFHSNPITMDANGMGSVFDIKNSIFVSPKYLKAQNKSRSQYQAMNGKSNVALEVYNLAKKIKKQIARNDFMFNKVIVADGNTIITSDKNRKIKVWNIATGDLIKEFNTDDYETYNRSNEFLKTLGLPNMVVNEKRNECYYLSLVGSGIKIWNYGYNLKNELNGVLAPVSRPFFISDSIVVYKKAKKLEFFNIRNLKVVKSEQLSFSENFDLFGTDKKHFFIRQKDKIQVWNSQTLEKVSEYKLNSKTNPRISSGTFSKYIFLSRSSGINEIMELNNAILTGKKSPIALAKEVMHLTNSGKKNNPASYSSTVDVLKNTDGQLQNVDRFNVPGIGIQEISVSPDEKEMLILSLNNINLKTNVLKARPTSIFIYDMEAKKLKKIRDTYASRSTFSTSGKLIAIANKETLEFVDLTTLKIINKYDISNQRIEHINELKFIDDDLLAIQETNKTRLFNIDSKKWTTVDRSFGKITTPSSKNVICGSENGGLSFYTKGFKNKLFSRYSLKEETGGFVLTPQLNYWYTSKARNVISFVKDDRTFSFEQFDLQYHRPDLVIESLSEILDQQTINKRDLYRAAYYKRIKRLGFDQIPKSKNMETPTLKITNEANIPRTTADRNKVLLVEIKDSLSKPIRIDLTINGVKINQNFDIKKTSAFNYMSQIEIPLNHGKNKISLSATNQNGIKSLKRVCEIEFIGKNSKQTIYLVGLGVADYTDLSKLSFPKKDIVALKDSFKTLKNIEVKSKIMYDGMVSRKSLGEIASFLSEAQEDDIIIMFASGHGLLVENQYFYATYSSNKSNIQKTGITYEDFELVLDKTRSRKRLFLLNTCYSGEVFGAANLEDIAAINLMRQVFTDLKTSNGTTIISASEGSSLFYENSGQKNGLLAQIIIELMAEKNSIYKSEFCKAIVERAAAKTRLNPLSSSAKDQLPLVRYENTYTNYRIW